MLNPRAVKVWEKDLKSGKLRKRLFKGIPDAVRGEVWLRLLHINKTKEEQIGKYEVTNHHFSIILLLFNYNIMFIYRKGNAKAGSTVLSRSTAN